MASRNGNGDRLMAVMISRQDAVVEQLTKVREEVAALKVKCGVWSAVASAFVLAIARVLDILINYPS